MTTSKAPAEMSAEEALEAYGFVDTGSGAYVKLTSDTESWVKVEGGWHCLAPVAAASPLVIGARPWGRPYGETGRLQVPYRQLERFAGVSGLHPLEHQDMFEWTWPDWRVAEIHAFAYTAEGDQASYGKRWKRNEAGELVQDRSPNPQRVKGDTLSEATPAE